MATAASCVASLTDASPVLVQRYHGKRINSPNDLVFKSNGDLYFTDPPFGLPNSYRNSAKELPFQGVYRLGRDGRLTLLTKELSGPNGIASSPDERTLYVSNADAKRLVWMAYGVKSDGTLGPGQIFYDGTTTFAGRRGTADGDATLLGWFDFGGNVGNVAWGEDGSTLFIAANAAVYRVRLSTVDTAFERREAQHGRGSR
jgi:gluconolactonase